MKSTVAIIGGTGIGERLLQNASESISVETEYGTLNAKLHTDGALLIARHDGGHKVPPHKVNYRAMATGLRSLGVKYCLSSAAVGSLRTGWDAGTLVVLSDFLDLTGRQLTLFDDTVVHTDFSEPFSPEARRALLACGEAVDGGIYVGANGPRYETPAEINLYKQFGGDVVGMTASTEAILMREAGIGYACLAVVTNLAAGLTATKLSHTEVVDVMKQKGETVTAMLLSAAKKLDER